VPFDFFPHRPSLSFRQALWRALLVDFAELRRRHPDLRAPPPAPAPGETCLAALARAMASMVSVIAARSSDDTGSGSAERRRGGPSIRFAMIRKAFTIPG
jgi:hypothetical protein